MPSTVLRWITLLPALLLASRMAVAQDTPHLAAPVTLPLAMTPDGMLTLAATLSDSLPLRLILDTGAGLDILAPRLIRRVHGIPLGGFTGIRMAGDRIDVTLFRVPSLAIGPWRRSGVVVAAWDMLDSLGLDGILSLNGFRNQPLTIAITDGMLTLETARSLARRRRAGLSVPLQLADTRGLALDVFAPFAIGTEAAECSLDTGSQAATISLRYLAPLAVDTAAPGVTRRETRTVTGARQVRFGVTIPAMALASAPTVRATRPRVMFSDIIYDCVVGTEFWTGHTFTIDILGRNLIVGRPGNP